VQKECKIN